MQKLLKLKSNKKIKIRLAQLKDLKFIFEIHNQNVLSKNFFSTKKVTFKEHKKWFDIKLKEKMLFICSDKFRIGYIRYDILRKKSLSVSIAIKKKYKRNGYGKFMLQKTLNYKKISNQNIYAFVKKNNFVSKNFFLNNGFKPTKKNAYLIKPKIK